MEHHLTHMKKRIMRRIYVRYVLRKLQEPVALELVALVGCTSVSYFLVSLNHVFSNASSAHNLSDLSFFYYNAFVNTELTVKTLLIGLVLAAILVTRRLASQIISRTGKIFGRIFIRARAV